MGKAETLKKEIDLLPYQMLGEVDRFIKKIKHQSKIAGDQRPLLSQLATYSFDDNLPSDLAEQHDYYLYGVSKK